MIRWEFKHFSELQLFQLYELLRLRQQVFSVEQKICYVDCDRYDQKSWHLFGWYEREGEMPQLAAYLRLIEAGVKAKGLSIGRVVTAREFRGKGLGRLLMEKINAIISQDFAPCHVSMAAQSHLEAFYNSCGFNRPKGTEEFWEEGILHLEMERAWT